MSQQSLITFEPSDSPFEAIYVDITHRCQMACANCYLPNRVIPDMDVEKLYDVLRNLPGKTDIRLIGGEPTLRNDLVSIVRTIVDLGHRPMLITNGLKLSDLEYCKDLKEAGLAYAQISLNGFNDDSIYKIIDKMECAKQKMSAIENCDQVGIGVAVSTILIKNINDHLFSEIINYMKKFKKSTRVNFRNVGDLGRSMAGEIDNLTFDDLISLTSKETNVSMDEIKKYMSSPNQIRFPYKIGAKRSETIWIKLTDWQNYPLGVIDREMIIKNSVKGRISQEFKLVPFFEHVKLNEFGY